MYTTSQRGAQLGYSSERHTAHRRTPGRLSAPRRCRPHHVTPRQYSAPTHSGTVHYTSRLHATPPRFISPQPTPRKTDRLSASVHCRCNSRRQQFKVYSVSCFSSCSMVFSSKFGSNV